MIFIFRRRQKDLKGQLAEVDAVVGELAAKAKESELESDIPKLQEAVGKMARDLAHVNNAVIC